MVGPIGEVTDGDLVVAAQGKCREQDPEEERLIRALRAGDEASFNKLVDAYHASLIRIARSYVGSDDAEEVAQEAWLGVLNGLDGFQGRSSLKTWIFHILVNCARKRRVLDGSNRLSGFFEVSAGAAEPLSTSIAQRTPLRMNWDGTPEAQLLSEEIRAHIQRAIQSVPQRWREVVVLRDVEGLSPGEVCELLGISIPNQRVILFRARTRIRKRLEFYLGESRRREQLVLPTP